MDVKEDGYVVGVAKEIGSKFLEYFNIDDPEKLVLIIRLDEYLFLYILGDEGIMVYDTVLDDLIGIMATENLDVLVESEADLESLAYSIYSWYNNVGKERLDMGRKIKEVEGKVNSREDLIKMIDEIIEDSDIIIEKVIEEEKRKN